MTSFSLGGRATSLQSGAPVADDGRYRSGGEGDYFGFGARLFLRRGKFAFGAQPVFHRVAGRGAAFEIDFIGAGGNLVLRRFGFFGGILCLRRRSFFRLRHASLLPRTTV